jgi:hypothetical protein
MTSEERQDAADSELLLGESDPQDVDAWKFNQDEDEEVDFRMDVIPTW